MPNEILDPLAAPGLRWGIIGAGYIAGKFTNAVTKHTASEVVAVGSRDRAKAERFAAANGIPDVSVGYEALVCRPDIDAVYVATPHSLHSEHAMLALAAGKPVLVEKPFTPNEKEGRAVASAAREAGLFAMEAMWTRFLPHMAALRAVIDRGEIGDVVHVHADHGQFFPFDPEHRIYNPLLAGGALLDLGVYPLSFVHDLLGAPETVTAVGTLAETGVDGQVSIILDYPGRVQASVYTTLWALTAISARITGTEGRIELNGPFLRPTSFTVTGRHGTRWDFDATVQNGFQYEVAEFARCVAEGRTESQILSLDDSLGVIRTMDGIRRQIGVSYPGEEQT
ncbi:MAG TPA: Gfo/Idh/MocA family oxidoreductase [Terrimesophilobacter sp.]|jgi:Predicted dehydrogenases and related proteins|uniref:Gfo/Idh/MocA family protein n=1 Tax=Terrimesophilobacter sp. TaxID=2906435 RepID=UPI002F94A5E6